MSGLDRVLRPASIAVLGASRNPAKRGHQVVRSLLQHGYPGRVVPVHPEGGALLGLTVATAIGEVDPPVDVVYVALPAARAPDAVRACGEAGVGGAVVPAVGFRETGRGGEALEKRLGAAARDTGIRVVGPNTSGIINTAIGMNLVGMQDVPTGGLALLAQSGNVALDVINGLRRSGLGLSVYVGVGNELDIAFDEYVRFLADDPATSAVMIYAEGFRDGRRFLDVAHAVCRTKPIVLLKGGRSSGGVAAARSHTGAIAGSYPVLRVALRQMGISEVLRSDELIPVAHTLAAQPTLADGHGVAILSDGGGHGTLMSDALAELDVPLAPLSSHTRRRLRSLLGPAANVANPVDLAGAADADPRVFAATADVLLRDRSVGGLAVVGLFGGYAVRFDPSLEEAELAGARELVRLAEERRRPLVVHTLYADRDTGPLACLRKHHVPVVGSIEVAARCIRAVYARGEFLARDHVTLVSGAARGADPPALLSAEHERRSNLLESEVRELLEVSGVPVTPYVVCRSAAGAAKAAREFGSAVALKVLSPAVPHKSEAGGVELHLRGDRRISQAFKGIVTQCTHFALAQGLSPDIRGVLVTPMQPPPVAELLVGVHWDPHYGPVLTVGAGGVEVEVHRDTTLRGLPIGRPEVLEMLHETRIGQILKGFRGRPPADAEALADLVLGVAACALTHPEIVEIEANPVFAYPDRAVVVDARAFLDASAGSRDGSARTERVTAPAGE